MRPAAGISIVIRTSNSEKPLRTLLGCLKTSPQDEIIVVDTGSIDGTISVAEKAGATVVRNEKPFNYSHTLNLGFARAKNDWVLALSVHCIPVNADVLDVYRAQIAQVPEKTAVIYGLQVLSKKVYDKLSKETIIHRGAELPNEWRGGGNTNALYFRPAWSLHFFDESIPRGEDGEWREWALRAGYFCAETAKSCMYYRHNKGPIYRYRKAYDDVITCMIDVKPMTYRQLVTGIAYATRHLLLENFCFIAWIGEVAHSLGSFAASRQKSKRHD